MIEYMTPGPAVTCTVPAPVLEYVPDDICAAPAPVIKHVTFAPDDTYIAPASPRVNREIRGLVNPQFSVFAVEASAPQVVGSFLAVDVSAPPVYKQVLNEQIAADTGSFERTRRCAVENIVHVPIPQIQEQFVESVQKIPQERLLERIEEPNKNTLIPHDLQQQVQKEREEQEEARGLLEEMQRNLDEAQARASETGRKLGRVLGEYKKLL